MKLKTLIIDDEPIALEKLCGYVAKVPFLELTAACRNGIEATEVLSSREVDVIFTDINMPDMNGMEFVSSLTNAPFVVFITAYSEYAVDSYRFSAVDYLLKPYGFADFQRAANKVLNQYALKMAKSTVVLKEQLSPDREDSIFIKVDYRYIRVSLKNIRYIKGYGEYLQIFTVKSTSPLLTLSSFSAIKEKLSPNFIQVHRSYIVNMELVQSVIRGRIIMDSDTYIPVGDSFKGNFQTYLSSHSVGTVSKKQPDSLDE